MTQGQNGMHCALCISIRSSWKEQEIINFTYTNLLDGSRNLIGYNGNMIYLGIKKICIWILYSVTHWSYDTGNLVSSLKTQELIGFNQNNEYESQGIIQYRLAITYKKIDFY